MTSMRECGTILPMVGAIHIEESGPRVCAAGFFYAQIKGASVGANLAVRTSPFYFDSGEPTSKNARVPH